MSCRKIRKTRGFIGRYSGVKYGRGATTTQQAILAAAMGLLCCAAGGVEGKMTRPMEPRAARLGESFALRIGEEARIEDVDVTLTFEEVSSDSRCPKDVTCIQAGEAVVVLALDSKGSRALLELAVPPGGASPAATSGSLRVVVLELEPQPESTKSIDASTYQATIRISQVR